jgi:hypothetical protein
MTADTSGGVVGRTISPKKMIEDNGLVLLTPSVELEYSKDLEILTVQVNRGFNEHATSPDKDQGSEKRQKGSSMVRRSIVTVFCELDTHRVWSVPL